MTFPNRLRRQDLKTAFAAHLRADMTDAERRLWAILRSKQVGGLKFRHQQPIGPYIVDFFCAAVKLVIELDGDQHGADGAVLYDQARTQWLVEHGYRVLRFPNGDVLRNPQNVVNCILLYFEEHGIPLPDPATPDRPSLKGRVED